MRYGGFRLSREGGRESPWAGVSCLLRMVRGAEPRVSNMVTAVKLAFRACREWGTNLLPLPEALLPRAAGEAQCECYFLQEDFWLVLAACHSGCCVVC